MADQERPPGASTSDAAQVTPATASTAAEEAAATDPPFAEARARCAEILALAGIDRVVFVDDANADQGRTIADVVAGLEAETLWVEDLAQVPELRGVLTEDDDLVDQRRAADLLGSETLDHDVAQAAIQVLADRQSAHSDTPDQTAISIVRDLLPTSVAYQPETLATWPDALTALLAGTREIGAPPPVDGGNQRAALVLFDRDFTNEAGGRADDGEVLVADLIRRTLDRHGVYVALVTHQVQPEDEDQRRVEIAARQDVADEAFVLISKGWLTSDQLAFLNRLQQIIGWTAARKLTALVVSVITNHYEASKEQLAALSPKELCRVLVHETKGDGIWEPDQVQRLLRAHLDGQLMAALRSNDDAWELADILRRASPTEYGSPPAFRDSEVRTLQRNEYYTSAEVLNLGFGISTGDIFRVVTIDDAAGPWEEARRSHKYFILVEQDCNVALRDGGVRVPEGPLTVAMIEFPAAKADDDRAPSISEFVLPLFCPATGQDAVVKLGRRKSIPWEAVDPTAWGIEGCAITPIDHSGGPQGRLDARWTDRFNIAVQRAQAIGAKLNELLGDATVSPEARATLVRGILGVSDLVRVDLTTSHLRCGIQRIARLREPHATELRVRSGAYQARLAFEAPLLAPAKREPTGKFDDASDGVGPRQPESPAAGP